MSLALSKAATLKPELRLAQALSEFEAILKHEEKAKLRAYRAQSPPNAADVMQFTAEIDHDALRKQKFRRCVAPRLCNFLQAVQGFTGVIDTFIGGSQLLTASAIWGVVKLSLQLASSISSYFEHLSEVFMSIGRSCPRNQEYMLLYPRSTNLKEAVCEYFIVIVQLCKHVVLFLDKPFLSQLLSASKSIVSNELDNFQRELERLAATVMEEIYLASARVQVQESQENSIFRNMALASSAKSQRWRKQQVELRFLDGCSTYDHQRVWRHLRKKGTVKWFIEDQEYIQWKAHADASVLHCTGALGSGKSVLAANVVDDVALRHPPTRVVYFFCRYDDLISLSARTIIGSIARQILEMIRPDMRDTVSNVNSNTLDTEGITDILLTILSTISDRVPNLTLVIDGIDECGESDARSALECLGRLMRSRHTIKLFCSSRLDVSPWVAEVLLPDHVLSMAASSSCDEMTVYIEDTLEAALVSGRLRVGDLQIVDMIRDKLLNDAHGMYLWVAFQIDAICFEQTDQDILDALEDIPRDLPETFNRILGKMRGPRWKSSSPISSVNVFRIVAGARRPLMLEELREAISIELGVTAWDPRKVVNDIWKLLESCGSLLVIDEEDQTVRFTHQSVLQFLCSELVSDKVKDFKIDLPSADRDMGEICVTYLNSERHNTQLVKPVEQKSHLVASSATLSGTIPSSTFAGKIALRIFRKRPDLKHTLTGVSENTRFPNSNSGCLDKLQHAFLDYARKNWLDHTKRLNYKKSPIIWPLWKRLIAGEINVVQLPWTSHGYDLNRELRDWVLQHEQWNIIFMMVAHYPSLDGRLLLRVLELDSSLRYISVKDKTLAGFLQPFRNDGSEELLRRRSSSAPLYIASSIGHVECVRLLLEHGADPDFDNFGRGTALYAACDQENPNTPIVRLLLESGADANVQGGRYGTPLQAACIAGGGEIVKLLLENGADVNIQSREYGTTLQAASAHGHKYPVRLLLLKGADVNVRGGKHGTALQAACVACSEKIVKLLLQIGADVNIQGGEYCTALQAASAHGQDALVKLLLQKGADVNVQGGKHSTALQAAACVLGWETPVFLLLSSGANVNIQGGEYGTALQAACTKNQPELVRLLLQKGADVNVHGGKYGTALQAACAKGQTGLIELLLQNGADLDVQCGKYGTALQAACAHGKEEAVRLLLQRGADVNIQGGEYGTALQAACVLGWETPVILLLSNGADVNIQGGEYGTALQAACIKGQSKLVKLLLQKGADVNVHSGKYGSALQAAKKTSSRSWIVTTPSIEYDEVISMLLKHGAKK